MIDLDLANGCLEFIGSLVLWFNVYQTIKDKGTRGVSLIAVSFFALFSSWRLFYYLNFDQWMSFYGSLSLFLANSIWLLLIIFYRRYG